MGFRSGTNFLFGIRGFESDHSRQAVGLKYSRTLGHANFKREIRSLGPDFFELSPERLAFRRELLAGHDPQAQHGSSRIEEEPC